MGYRNVEPFTLSGLTAEQYRALLDKYGLKASARHVDVGTPGEPGGHRPDHRADNRILGIKYFGSGSTPIFPPIYTTEAQWVAYAEYLDQLGEAARKAGQTLMVHNHDIEFEAVFGGRTVFDIIAANTDPRNVVFQLDLYWAANGGGMDNPVEVLERYGKRIQLFHVKDMAAGAFPGPIEIVGEGIIDFPEIFAASKGPDEVLRRRARPALWRSDVRPVRGSPEGLRLSRLRDVLSAWRGGFRRRRPSRRAPAGFNQHIQFQEEIACEPREHSLPSPARWRSWLARRWLRRRRRRPIRRFRRS